MSGLLNKLCGRKRKRRVKSCVMIPGAVGVVFCFYMYYQFSYFLCLC